MPRSSGLGEGGQGVVHVLQQSAQVPAGTGCRGVEQVGAHAGQRDPRVVDGPLQQGHRRHVGAGVDGMTQPARRAYDAGSRVGSPNVSKSASSKKAATWVTLPSSIVSTCRWNGVKLPSGCRM